MVKTRAFTFAVAVLCTACIHEHVRAQLTAPRGGDTRVAPNGPKKTVVDLGGFRAEGMTVQPVNLNAFTAAGISVQPTTLSGFTATAIEVVPVRLAGFTATGGVAVVTDAGAAAEPDSIAAAGAPGKRAANGTFRVGMPTGTVSGKATFCSMPTLQTMMILFEGDDLTGGIVGKGIKSVTGTFDVKEEQDVGYQVAFIRAAAPAAGFTGVSGTVKITSATKGTLTGSFQITGKYQDAHGQEDRLITGSFAAIALGGCGG